MQKFFEDTTEATFIKSLCEQICLPIYDTIKEGDYIFEGCTYITQHYVIRCTSSGYYYTEKFLPQMGQNLQNTNASYIIVDRYVFGKYAPNISSKILLNSNYYNEKTHMLLGKYLHCIRDLFNVDLLGMYNVFTPLQIKNYYINTTSQEHPYGELVKGTNDWKCYIVPIKFNTKYNIHIDSNECLIKFVYKFGNKLVDSRLSDVTTIYKSPALFNNPFSIEAPTLDVNTYRKQKSLYAFIQLPKSCESSIVITEDTEVENCQISFINDGTTYGFSDKLIQYICGHVITRVDTIPSNFTYLKTLFKLEDKTDLWDEQLVTLTKEHLSDKPYFDKTSYVDVELERKLCQQET